MAFSDILLWAVVVAVYLHVGHQVAELSRRVYSKWGLSTRSFETSMFVRVLLFPVSAADSMEKESPSPSDVFLANWFNGTRKKQVIYKLWTMFTYSARLGVNVGTILVLYLILPLVVIAVAYVVDTLCSLYSAVFS